MSGLFGNIFRAFNITGRDAKVFVISLLLAFAIWLVHNLSLYYSEVVRVPVSAQCDIPGHSRTSSNLAVVTLRCRAAGFTQIRLRYAERKAPANVQFAFEDMRSCGQDTYCITSSDLEKYGSQILGNGTKLEAVLTDTLQFTFPSVAHKVVPVQPVYSISFKAQFINTAPLKIMPDSVTIYGEPTHLASVDKVFTEPMSLSNLSSPLHGVVRLERIKGLRISDESVSYSMDISRYVEIRAQLPVVTKNVPKGRILTAYPSMADVSFKCIFPVAEDPSGNSRIVIDYNDFINSLTGECLAGLETDNHGIISYEVEPSVFNCVESGL